MAYAVPIFLAVSAAGETSSNLLRPPHRRESWRHSGSGPQLFGSFEKFGVAFWGPDMRDSIFWLSILGPLIFGKIPFQGRSYGPLRSPFIAHNPKSLYYSILDTKHGLVLQIHVKKGRSCIGGSEALPWKHAGQGSPTMEAKVLPLLPKPGYPQIGP